MKFACEARGLLMSPVEFAIDPKRRILYNPTVAKAGVAEWQTQRT